MDDDPKKREYRDIQLDYPGINEHLQKQELGYRKGGALILVFGWKYNILRCIIYFLFTLSVFIFFL